MLFKCVLHLQVFIIFISLSQKKFILFYFNLNYYIILYYGENAFWFWPTSNVITKTFSPIKFIKKKLMLWMNLHMLHVLHVDVCVRGSRKADETYRRSQLQFRSLSVSLLKKLTGDQLCYLHQHTDIWMYRDIN